MQRVGTLSLLFVPPAEGGGMEINMNKVKDNIENIYELTMKGVRL